MIHSTPQSPSHSRLSCLHHCSRKYWHRYVCDYEESDEVVAPLHAGKVMHAGLDAYYRTNDIAKAKTAISHTWLNTMFHGDNSWLTYGHMQLRMEKYVSNDSGDWKPMLLTQDQIQWENVLEHDAKWDLDGNLILCESSFKLKIVDGLSTVSVPDLVLMHDFGDGEVPVVVDHKCRFGWINDMQRSAMEVGHQLRMGALAVEALTGLQCRDGWMNSIYVGKNSCNPKSKAKMRELSMFGPWSDEQMQSTWDWIKCGIAEMEVAGHIVLTNTNFPVNPGLHCHYCEFREECVGE